MVFGADWHERLTPAELSVGYAYSDEELERVGFVSSHVHLEPGPFWRTCLGRSVPACFARDLWQVAFRRGLIR